MERQYAKKLLEQTRQNYNLLAESYARTRAFIPEDIKELAEYAESQEKVLDLGCASGRFFEVLKNRSIVYYGVDKSEKLIEMAKKNHSQANFQIADALTLPFPDNFFDKVFSISVLHHIPSKELREQFLAEAKRVLKPKGLLILRVWDFWKRKSALSLILKYTLLKLIGKSKIDFYDIFLPWKDSRRKILANRYFHCFGKNELEQLVKKSGFKVKECQRKGRDPRTNIYLIAEK